MVERVAKAIYELDRERRKLKRSWEYLPDLPNWDNREQWREMARVAIKAMRDPTEAMADSNLAGIILCRIADAAEESGEFLGGFEDTHEAAAEIWRDMIDAALEG